MAYQLTDRAYREKSSKLQLIYAELEQSKEAMRAAAAEGDLRENAEYESARDKVVVLTKQKSELEEELDRAEIVYEDNSQRITIGSYVEVTKVDRKNQPLGPTRTFRVEEHGDTVIAGILGVHSSLGKIILNGTSNYYDIPDNGGIRYQVKKVFKH